MPILMFSWLPLAGAALWLADPAPLRDEPRLVCDQIHLMAASGVVGPEHRYTFSAHCYRDATETTSSPGTSRSVNVVRLDFTVVGKGRWERGTGRATEELKFSGSRTGTRMATGLGCTQDPWLKDPPGGLGTCKSVSVQAVLSSAGSIPLELIEPKIFLLARRIALAEAQALSAATASSSGTPPPPPPDPTGPPPALLTIEGEHFVNSQRFHVAGGRVGMQPMTGFGSGWSGNAQLLWMDGGVGSALDLLVNFPASATYTVDLYMTRAPDYGNLQVKVEGKSAQAAFMGYSPKVGPAGAYRLGSFWFAAGQRKVSLVITGRYPDSRGFLVGIDRAVFSLAGR
jgi:hypothetical protein